MPGLQNNIATLSLRNKVVLFIILMLMIFNHGFMQLRIASVPLAELILIVYILTSKIPLVLKHFFAVVNPIPFLSWWIIGIGGALYYLSKNGIWAMRDATNAIESLYLLVGFAFFASAKAQKLLIEKYHLFLYAITIYGLTYPLAGILREFSPTVVAGSGARVPLFFFYTNSSLLLMLSVLYFSLVDKPKNYVEKNALVCSAVITIFTIGFFQERSLYLHIFALSVILVYLKPQLFKRLFLIGIGMVLLLILIARFDIKIEGRLGHSLSLEFLAGHASTMIGMQAEGLEGSANGVNQRAAWWTSIIDRWSLNNTNMVFGLGYGFPLIDFYLGGGIPVREPHNSYLSVLARSGLIGFTAWSVMHYFLFSIWTKLYRFYKSTQQIERVRFLVLLLGYFVLVLLRSIVQDGFEKPFIAVPYYFFWGCILRMYWFEKYAMQPSEVTLNQRTVTT